MKNTPKGLYYDPGFVTEQANSEILRWLSTIYPIWENRYSESNPPPPGKTQRALLRPVYWLGNWQFACLNYYHPPKGIQNRCVRAEPFPPVFIRLLKKVEGIGRRIFSKADLPPRWHLNTCLVNLYGARLSGDRLVDVARVGEHKDFEPGPVASISLGERALFQFVRSRGREQGNSVVFQQWLGNGSLQLFGGELLKRHLFHRIQRVDRRAGFRFALNVAEFETRRINFTFRYVPEEHIVSYVSLPERLKHDVKGYVAALAKHSAFFRAELGQH